MKAPKLLLLALLLVLVAAFFWFDLQRLLTLEGLQQGLGEFDRWWQERPLLVGGLFLLFYIAVTALSLPGAAVMTVAAGALFGLLWGTLLVSFASSIGATLAFLVSRYLLRDLVQQRFGKRLSAINDGVRSDGAFYLFAMRLVPLFPFFLINLLMGLTPIRARTFYWVSQLGMLAGTLVYVNAGTQLAQLQSLGGILSPALLFSFVLLGLFPLLARRLLNWLQGRRVYAGFRRPRRFDRNLIVIGGGAGGLVTAYISALVKAKVTLVEAGSMGGDCLNTGCVPSKALIQTARQLQRMRQGERYGLEPIEPRFGFRKVMERVQSIIQRIEPHDSAERYRGLGVDVVEGYARLQDPWTVEITRPDGSLQQLTSRAIVLATGAKAALPDLPGLAESDYVTSDTLWSRLAQMDEPPARLLVLGGGPIGCELAQCFARLGSSVTLVQSAPRLMMREDSEVSALVEESLQADGVKVLTHCRALRCETITDGQRLMVEREGDQYSIAFDLLLCAVGREARLTGFGLEGLGIACDKSLQTNAWLQTLLPNIYAAGDVAGPFQFTHVAAHQAWYAAVNALFGQLKMFRVDYRLIPWTTFVDPEVARVGLCEREAREQGQPFEVTRYSLAELDRAITDSSTRGFIKVLTEPGSDRILGVTIVGERAGDLLAEFVLAMKYGLGLKKILATIHVYPTWAEANKYAAGEWSRAHAPQWLMPWLQRYHSWCRGSGFTRQEGER
ncbi:FAD-dependent oxidoreductase [Pseudomaricurvus sp. HS19]|uniref:FAD-dependent oxidoreductase n=1 Tax=Pseudomaricurvus sp. HS19 TaxID=2692626 RepID=UPI00136A4322|nr:bifunctional TVP38/TMEM64 family protein/FAD-dependent oxidoreductase [Pseudomaricurvus sp. HS19]MYM64458.1 FAD-dependent oxidoreductase [Pseudomaricurvus sp. HS19]